MGYKIEGHCHTAEASPCAVTYADEVIKTYSEKGYSGVIISDHFCYSYYGDKGKWNDIVDKFLSGYKNAKIAGEKYKIKVYLAMEIRFLDSNNDYLVYGIDEEFLYNNPWLYMKSLKYLDQLCDGKYLIIQAHPYRWDNTLADIKYLDGIEYNNTNPNNDCRNHLAYESWIKTDLIGTCGCDFHHVNNLKGQECMVFNNLPNDNQELIKEFRNKNFIVTK